MVYPPFECNVLSGSQKLDVYLDQFAHVGMLHAEDELNNCQFKLQFDQSWSAFLSLYSHIVLALDFLY
jgi:hypothetical protein